MKKILKRFATTFALTILLPIPASASLIIDNGTYLTDTDSGLDWLDVTASVNRSYSDVSSQFGSGGDFDGWRYATSSELSGLIHSWVGLPISSSLYISHTDGAIDGLVELLGSTLDSHYVTTQGTTWDDDKGFVEGEGLDYTYGMIEDTVASNGNHIMALIFDNDAGSLWGDDDFSYTGYSSQGVNTVTGYVGSYLVRGVQVPEPATFVLLAAGLVGLGLSGRKYKLFT